MRRDELSWAFIDRRREAALGTSLAQESASCQNWLAQEPSTPAHLTGRGRERRSLSERGLMAADDPDGTLEPLESGHSPQPPTTSKQQFGAASTPPTSDWRFSGAS